jgi:hypothetical protein
MKSEKPSPTQCPARRKFEITHGKVRIVGRWTQLLNLKITALLEIKNGKDKKIH